VSFVQVSKEVVSKDVVLKANPVNLQSYADKEVLSASPSRSFKVNLSSSPEILS
jgi:hypothetical protein